MTQEIFTQILGWLLIWLGAKETPLSSVRGLMILAGGTILCISGFLA